MGRHRRVYRSALCANSGLSIEVKNKYRHTVHTVLCPYVYFFLIFREALQMRNNFMRNAFVLSGIDTKIQSSLARDFREDFGFQVDQRRITAERFV